MNPNGIGIWSFYGLLMMTVGLTVWAVVDRINNRPTTRRPRVRFRYKVGRTGH